MTPKSWLTPKNWLLIWNFVLFCSFFYMGVSCARDKNMRLTWASCAHPEKVLFHHFQMFFIVFDHANACTSMHLLVQIHNIPLFFLTFIIGARRHWCKSLDRLYRRISFCLSLKRHYFKLVPSQVVPKSYILDGCELSSVFYHCYL